MTTNTVTISTKKDKDAPAVKTELTLNWEGVSEDDIKALAQQALIVKVQGSMRRGDDPIPEKLTINVAEHKVGTRTVKAKVDPLTAVMNLSPEDRAAFIEKLQASLS